MNDIIIELTVFIPSATQQISDEEDEDALSLSHYAAIILLLADKHLLDTNPTSLIKSNSIKKLD